MRTETMGLSLPGSRVQGERSEAMTGLGFWLALLQKIWYPSSMEKPQANDHILAVFKAAIDEIYGSRLDRAVLFGSRANGQAQADSDYDVALFLNSMPDRWIELDRLAALRVKLLDETGAFFDIKPYPMAAYLERSPLMHEIRREGIDL